MVRGPNLVVFVKPVGLGLIVKLRKLVILHLILVLVQQLECVKSAHQMVVLNINYQLVWKDGRGTIAKSQQVVHTARLHV